MTKEEIQKLIQLAKSEGLIESNKKDLSDNKEHVRMFITDNVIRKGKVKMEKNEVWKFYSQWAELTALGYRDFFKEFEEFFKPIRTQHKVYFELRRYYGQRRKRTKKKSEVQGIGQEVQSD